MTLSEALYTRLTGYAGVSGIASTRVYPLVLPTSASFPAIVYQQISGPEDLTHDGGRGLARARVQFSCWAETHLAAKQLASQVKLALHGFKSSDKNTGEIQAAEVAGEVDFYEEQTQRYRTIVDVIFWSRDTAA